MKKRFRHRVVFAVFKPWFRLYVKLRFNFKAHIYKKTDFDGPFLVLSNHVMAFDPIFMGLSFQEPIYYVASDMIFSIKYASAMLKYLVSPIPKTKYRSDTDTIKDIIKMVKSGGSIGIFPEGNATFFGDLMPIPPAIGKLVKLLKIPVVLYQIDGGYLTKPRWAKSVRKGKMTGKVVHTLMPEDYQDLDYETINQTILSYIRHSDLKNQYHYPVIYKGKALAEDIESAFFICPSCHEMDTIHSQGDDIYCKACDFHVKYSPTGRLKPYSEGHVIADTTVWHSIQKQVVTNKVSLFDPQTVITLDENERIMRVIKNIKKEDIGKATISLFKTHIRFDFDDKRVDWNIKDIQIAVQQKNKLIVYHQPTEETYYAINHPKRSAYKYVMLVEAIQKEMNANESV